MDVHPPSPSNGSAQQPVACPACEREVGYVNVVAGDFAFSDATPLTTGDDGTPAFQETGLEDGPQKAIKLRCDFCGEVFLLGVETGGR